MPTNSSPLIVVVALVVIGIILAALNLSGNNTTNPNPALSPTPLITNIISPTLAPTVTPTELSPAETVTQLYNWYLSQTPPIPVADYQALPYISDTLKRRLATMTSTTIINTLLCGNQNPLTFTATTVGQPTATTALVNIEQVFSTGSRVVPVSLIRTTDMWQINAVTCTQITPMLSPISTPSVSPTGSTPTFMPSP
jgi:hypothetical protein